MSTIIDHSAGQPRKQGQYAERVQSVPEVELTARPAPDSPIQAPALPGLNHAEAQELHQAIGQAISRDGDYLGALDRALELASVQVSGTDPDNREAPAPLSWDDRRARLQRMELDVENMNLRTVAEDIAKSLPDVESFTFADHDEFGTWVDQAWDREGKEVTSGTRYDINHIFDRHLVHDELDYVRNQVNDHVIVQEAAAYEPID